jgi:hypothetical protein
MRIAAVLALTLVACTPARRKTPIGVAVVAGATAGSIALRDPGARSDVAIELAVTSAAALVPASLSDDLRYGDDDDGDPPGTPGEAYSAIGGAFVDGFLLMSSYFLPPLAQCVAAEVREGKADRRGLAYTGAVAGALAGSIASSAIVVEALPKWARITLSAALIGTATTFGYQLGGGGFED